jgi:hypothetical protein
MGIITFTPGLGGVEVHKEWGRDTEGGEPSGTAEGKSRSPSKLVLH